MIIYKKNLPQKNIYSILASSQKKSRFYQNIADEETDRRTFQIIEQLIDPKNTLENLTFFMPAWKLRHSSWLYYVTKSQSIITILKKGKLTRTWTFSTNLSKKEVSHTGPQTRSYIRWKGDFCKSWLCCIIN